MIRVPLPPSVPVSDTGRYLKDGPALVCDKEPVVGNSWPESDLLDCCHNTNGAAPVQEAVRQGYGILTHNYGLSAPLWCDIFEVDCRPDRSWLPMEDPYDSTDPDASAGRVGDWQKPHPLVLAAYSARTLQARLDGAKAALREGGPAAAIDARLLLVQCLSGMTPAAKLKALAAAADAAMAAAQQEAAQQRLVSRQAMLQGYHEAQDMQWSSVQMRAAVRAVLALLKLQAHEALVGDVDAAKADSVHVAVDRCLIWLGTMDPYQLAGFDSGNQAALPWVSYENTRGTQIRQLVHALKRHCAQGDVTFEPLTMAPHYSLYFAAYAAKGQPGCGPTGQLVKQALASIKQVDPEGWVPRLLAGLESADATVKPSFMLGSKQEAMACCNMVGFQWLQISGFKHDCRPGLLPAVQRLLSEWGQQDAYGYVAEDGPDMQELYRLVAVHNVGRLPRSWCLTEHPTIERVIKIKTLRNGNLCQHLTALRAHLLVLTALAHATMNMPSIHTHWQYWQGSVAAARLGADNATDAAASLLRHANVHYEGAGQMIIIIKRRFGSAHQFVLEQIRLKAAWAQFNTHKLRWCWQAGKPEISLLELRTACQVAQELQEQPAAAASTVASEQPVVAQLISFLEAEVARAVGEHAHQQLVLHESDAQEATDQAGSASGSQQQQERQHIQACTSQLALPSERACCDQSASTGLASPGSSKATCGAHTSSAAADPDMATVGGGCSAASCQQLPPVMESAGTASSNGCCGSPGSTGQSAAAEEPTGPVAVIANNAVLTVSAAGNKSSTGAGPGHQRGKACTQCGGLFAKLKRCAGCGEVRYCGSSCQRLHWRAGHQAACSRRLLVDAGTKDQHLHVQACEAE